jgi:DNA polymerase I-like protein with 3'-5' exonuclease and polymerase domains
LGLAKVLTEIKNKKLNVDATQLSKELHKFKVRRFVKKIKRIAPYIKYDSFRTKTGRLAAYSNSFPILTMDKSYRKILKPNNDWFLEFDYNAAELRVMLGLSGKEQPKEDIHEWNLKNVYNGTGTREEAKKRIFAWLYNPESKDALSSKAYDRNELLNKHWDGTNVKTYFNREIEADAHHALNYIIQSTAADLFLRQMIEVWKLLKGKKSYIAFCMHDSLVIDFSEEEQYLLNELKEKFENTQFGKFKVNSSAGKNYGEMKRLNVH